MKKIIFAMVMCLLVGFCSNVQAGEIIEFPDPWVEDQVRQALSIQARYDKTIYERPIKKSYMKDLNSFGISYGTIKDISGLEHATNLKAVVFAHSNLQVEDFTPLTKLPNLEYLSLVNTGIEDISFVSELQNIKELHLAWNNISDITPLIPLIENGHFEEIGDLCVGKNRVDTEKYAEEVAYIKSIMPIGLDMQEEPLEPEEPEVPVEVERIYGQDRYQTAVEISNERWENAKTVVLARGDDYADALAGVPYAYKLDAPVLLTRTERLSSATDSQLNKLNTERVIILGGTSAVSKNVESTLEQKGIQVERIAGKDRFETAALIADKVSPGGIDTAVVTPGFDFQDALVTAPYAAQEGYPMLLSREDRVPQTTLDALAGVSKTIAVGNPDVLNDKALNKLPGAIRVSNPNHYTNAVEIANHFNAKPDHVYLATGKVFADSITGGVMAAFDNSPIILVGDSVPSEVEKFIKDNNVNQARIFGGSNAVNHEIESFIKNMR